jgi:hypothetical protein
MMNVMSETDATGLPGSDIPPVHANNNAILKPLIVF